MKFNKITAALASVMMLWGAAACSDDSTPTPLDKTTAEIQNATFNTLSFEWGRVKDAVQYSYQLSETATGKIITTAITQQTKATFTDLTPSTDYTLTVLAYAAINSDNTTSEPIVLTARTSDIIAIESPQPVMSREVNTIIVEWNHITSAQSYSYKLVEGEGNVISEGVTGALYANFSNMQSGKYTFTVTALIDAPGLKNSEPASITFDFVRERMEIWKINGTYTSSLTDSEWDATLVAYDDNSYDIQGWYGVNGYDLTFTIDEQNAADMFVMSADKYTYNEAGKFYSVPTGLTTAGLANINVYPADNQCAFEGTPAKGSVLLHVSDGSKAGNDIFKWTTIECTIDDLCGDWVRHYTCYDNYYQEGYNNTMNVTITKVDDTTVKIPLPLFDNEYADVTVNLQTMTYTINPTTMSVGYIFANSTGENLPLTGMISPTNFSINGWGLYFSGYNYYSNTAMEFYRAEE